MRVRGETSRVTKDDAPDPGLATLALAVTSTEVIALIGGAVTVAVAISSSGFAYLTGRRAQEHERRLKQGERAYENCKTIYLKVARYAIDRLQEVRLTEPDEPVGDPPSRLLK
jgi:hypothetical protein